MYDHVLIILAQMRSKTSSCSGETPSSPWLSIPLEDYEALVALPAVGQARILAKQLAILIERHAPVSVARRGGAGSALMKPVVAKLSMDKMISLAAYTASLNP